MIALESTHLPSWSSGKLPFSGLYATMGEFHEALVIQLSGLITYGDGFRGACTPPGDPNEDMVGMI
jgi:hypothetical protein